MESALEGLNVLSFAQVISAASSTRMLADFGAEVIKIEPPNGDVMRRVPPYKTDSSGVDQSGFFISLSCGKKAISLDLKKEEGREIAKRLALEWADVLVENFSLGVMKGFGLDYETLSAENPELIYASLSGYGQTGPYASRRAYDICIQAESGLTMMNGEEGRTPHKIGYSVTDYSAGRDLVIGILAALRMKDLTGKGQHVDVAMFDSGVSLTEHAIPLYSINKELLKTQGNRHPAASPHNLYKTKDGFINIIVIEDKLWARLVKAMGRPELIKDPDLATLRNRLNHLLKVDIIVEEWTSRYTTAEISAKLAESKLPYGVLNDMKAVMENEQVLARNMVPEVDQTDLGKVHVPGCPIKFSSSRAEVRGPAPMFGEHNKDVLCGMLGYSEKEYKELLAKGVLRNKIK